MKRYYELCIMRKCSFLEGYGLIYFICFMIVFLLDFLVFERKEN